MWKNNNVKTCGNTDQTFCSEGLPFLCVMGYELKAFIKPLKKIALWWSEGFYRAIDWVSSSCYASDRSCFSVLGSCVSKRIFFFVYIFFSYTVFIYLLHVYIVLFSWNHIDFLKYYIHKVGYHNCALRENSFIRKIKFKINRTVHEQKWKLFFFRNASRCNGSENALYTLSIIFVRKHEIVIIYLLVLWYAL